MEIGDGDRSYSLSNGDAHASIVTFLNIID
ncbi:hypothetical protein COLO4_07871 [Corchorus olitorius]|uniref:Uncharacterized protein n=1 Tax=Corchorus olitorius TaxID=93759 RepID=A0A1R3KI92_9ROSI|nr:hypothetical protein COLO4_07871 [Corchorus olitorius]